MNRRTFIKSTVSTGAGISILPKLKLFGADAPSNKLNIALIGVGGRGRSHWGWAGRENIVALCDVHELNLAKAGEKFKGAKQYHDWRKCLEQKDIDSVVCSTTDHTHAFVGNWALNRDMHIYLEKPIGITVEEARVVRANYLKRKDKVATQLGTQRHAMPNFNRVRELVKDGVIGELKSVYAWGNRQIRRDGYPAAEGEPPKHLHYDLWIGPSSFHPYSPSYFKGNCLQWNMYWDFGTGQIGDMGAHTMDLAWNALDADLPTSAEATGDLYNPDITPVEMSAKFELPANDWRGAISVNWYQGGAMPKNPHNAVDLKKIGHGAMFKGDKGLLVADFGSRLIIPIGGDSNMTYYKPRSEDAVIPNLGGFGEQWVNAAKGDPTKTSCNFDYSGKMMETMNLGLVAYRAEGKLAYDAKTGKITNNDEANALISKKYRKGWVLNG